ncbi:MAG: porin family protein [Parvibaculaceae bacterium]|nr:porin family protein [Parvibaculaceae bacterium]
MKHLVKLATATALFAALAAPAYADEVKVGDTYFKLSGGALVFDDLEGAGVSIELDTGWTVSGAIGYNLNPNVALELELTYLTADFDSGTALGVTVPIDGDLSSFLTMVNAHFHANPGGNFDPYFGAGIGAAFSDLKVNSIGGVPANIDDSSTDLALQGTAGINMALGGGKLGAQYRYIWTDTGGNNSDEITAHAFTLHYMFSF